MWSALMNGGGGGAGGGYVSAPGWEFVPCTGMERSDRGRGKNPLRRVSSPPTVFSQSYEPGLGAAAEGDGGENLGLLRGQMWPGPEAQQHSRLKKKLEDLRRRHVQDKEEWTKEKESLLREVADIQGGENRRILLDLKTVLEEVQLELKREEEKRSELQLQYARDRCAWEQEKAELKCRIVQLEAREAGGSVAGGAGFVAAQRARVQNAETSAPHGLREEPRRARRDSAGMDLRCRPEHDRDWSREKAELLQKFDVERREWESQLKDMQRKIEELYCEVRAKREGIRRDGEDLHLLSVRSTSTGESSLLSDSCSSPSGDHQYGPSPAGATRERDGYQADVFVEMKSHGHRTPDPPLKDFSDLRNASEESPLLTELSYRSMKKKNTTALNAALKEIARVSEELCSYQEEIRKKSGDKRSPPETLHLQGEKEPLQGGSETRLELEETSYDLSQIYSDLQALGRESWFALSPENTVEQASRAPRRLWRTNSSDPDVLRDRQTSPGALSDIDTAPPVPPRTSSWNLSPTHPEPELHIPESPLATVRKCHSPCVLVDRKCSSPSIVRKFEAMLQENEGKVFIDGVMASCPAPSNSNCNQSCCHNRWSCDAGKLSSSKPSSYGTVQKSFSEVNILSAGTDFSDSLRSPSPGLQKTDTKLPVDQLLSSLELSPASPELQGSRRNITLEQKTVEFNRTLFQAEMGRGVQEKDGCPAERQQSLSDAGSKFQPHCLDVTSSATSDSIQKCEFRLSQSRCDPEVEEFRIMHEFLSDFPAEDSVDELSEGSKKPSPASGPRPEVKHSLGTSEPDFSKSTLPIQNLEDISPKMEFRYGARAQSEPEVQPKAAQEPSRPGRRMMNDHPWKPLTLAAYPRPEGSRSNYGAVEKILKNYESAARAQQSHSPKQKEHFTDLNILEMQPLPSTLKHLYLDEKDLTVQEKGDAGSSSAKLFSRPVRPANRRLPSRWANRSPPPSRSPGGAPPSFHVEKYTSSFSRSEAFHVETMII
ncbi:protein SOGA3a [Neosynchiropus ocellatus]